MVTIFFVDWVFPQRGRMHYNDKVCETFSRIHMAICFFALWILSPNDRGIFHQIWKSNKRLVVVGFMFGVWSFNIKLIGVQMMVENGFYLFRLMWTYVFMCGDIEWRSRMIHVIFELLTDFVLFRWILEILYIMKCHSKLFTCLLRYVLVEW